MNKGPTRLEVIAYMKGQMEDHTDGATGEVNTTSLAEDACDHFNAYVGDWEIPDLFFDWSFEAVYGSGN